ncbi:excalibur calcium-binding domain-containing protein [Demequina aurantiaca]|uniref:excalibur calcium-binding domain-containing protein n=1 Tax=Demequina aurantiaca TaxID=676200 RepID=UPI003D33880F
MAVHTFRRSLMATVTIAAVALSFITPEASAADEGIDMPRGDLRNCVTDALGLSQGATISTSQMLELTVLQCPGRFLGKLDGLEHATNLRTLNISTAYVGHSPDPNATRDLFVPLTGLPHLTSLYADTSDGEQIDFGPLATLPALTVLVVDTIEDNSLSSLAGLDALVTLKLNGAYRVTDIESLQLLPSLRELRINQLNVHSVWPLGNLTRLTSLDIHGDFGGDLTGLSELSNLTHLDIQSPQVKSLHGIETMGSLRNLRVTNSPVSSLEPVAALTGLETLTANFTDIEDLAPLIGLDNLQELQVFDAEVSDVTPITQLPSLKRLGLGKNHISDLSPLGDVDTLEYFDARDQTIVAPPIQACVLAPWGLVKDDDGRAVHLDPPPSMGISGPEGAIWSVPTLQTRLYFEAGYRRYSGSVSFSVSPAGEPCSWRDTLSVGLPARGEPGDIVKAQFNWSTGAFPETESQWKTSRGDSIRKDDFVMLPSVDQGSFVTFEVRATTPGFDPTPVTKTVQVNYQFSTAAKVSISGVAATGRFLTAKPSGFSAEAHFTYVWMRNGKPISGARGFEYETTTADLGKSITVQVEATDYGYIAATRISPGVTILKPLTYTTPKITGVLDAGQMLKANVAAWGPAPVALTYQWKRDGVNVTGATASSYLLKSADAGRQISVTVTGKKSGYTTQSRSSSGASVHRLFSTAPTPKVTGTPTVGYTLTMSRGTWSPSATTYSYQWYRDSAKISGATKTTYKAQTADAGHKITVAVTSRKSGYTTTTRHSVAVAIGKKLTSAPTPTVSGTAKVGSTLTGKVGTWGPGTVTKKYQWYVNGSAVAGATGTTFKVRPQDAYKKVTFKVSASKSGYTSTSRTSASTTPLGIKYSNCTEMRKHYPGGVAKSSSVKDTQNGVMGGKILASTYVSASLYTLNATSDRDKDGWACEP